VSTTGRILIPQTPIERGAIRNRSRAKQLRDFTGLRFGKITPTDIDGFLEFNDTLFVYFEAKQVGATMPYGQKLALTRQCNAIDGTENDQHVTRMAALIVIEHDTEADQDVDYAKAKVTSVYRNREWRTPSRGITGREAVECLLRLAGLAQYLPRERAA